jgi:hypothetical protein
LALSQWRLGGDSTSRCRWSRLVSADYRVVVRGIDGGACLDAEDDRQPDVLTVAWICLG